jgi:septation ring formation regulator EzrA
MPPKKAQKTAEKGNIDKRLKRLETNVESLKEALKKVELHIHVDQKIFNTLIEVLQNIRDDIKDVQDSLPKLDSDPRIIPLPHVDLKKQNRKIDSYFPKKE